MSAKNVILGQAWIPGHSKFYNIFFKDFKRRIIFFITGKAISSKIKTFCRSVILWFEYFICGEWYFLWNKRVLYFFNDWFIDAIYMYIDIVRRVIFYQNVSICLRRITLCNKWSHRTRKTTNWMTKSLAQIVSLFLQIIT